ncbi:hypothetical protein Vadar_004697 [Vaccinium darrowii]|uniref:Uncharacterized protein n=1 Tax=Vaccinium darrowii TaxID=229202 RepID=A0ACB7YU13_9ERIC|nr:hypothetical protein Vadar_004697 [Vaccinium darrowii]
MAFWKEQHYWKQIQFRFLCRVCGKKCGGGEKQSINRVAGKQSKQLRRLAIEKLLEIPPAVSSYAEEMSGEEFRRTVEAFIARQPKFLREEELSTIVIEYMKKSWETEDFFSYLFGRSVDGFRCIGYLCFAVNVLIWSF